MKTLKVYLCSRVAYEARPLNSTVAASLREVGFKVYVPHEQAPNNLSPDDIREGRYDKETIFRIDHAAMREADICIVVGRVGRDCAWEIGWFAARGVPIVHVPGPDTDWQTSPMLIPSLTARVQIKEPTQAGEQLKHLLEEAA